MRYKKRMCCVLHFVENIAENVLILPTNFFLGEDVESKFLQEKFGNALFHEALAALLQKVEVAIAATFNRTPKC